MFNQCDLFWSVVGNMNYISIEIFTVSALIQPHRAYKELDRVNMTEK